MSKTISLFAENMTAYQEAAKEAGFNRSACAEMAGMSKAQWSQLANGDIFAPLFGPRCGWPRRCASAWMPW